MTLPQPAPWGSGHAAPVACGLYGPRTMPPQALCGHFVFIHTHPGSSPVFTACFSLSGHLALVSQQLCGRMRCLSGLRAPLPSGPARPSRNDDGGLSGQGPRLVTGDWGGTALQSRGRDTEAPRRLEALQPNLLLRMPRPGLRASGSTCWVSLSPADSVSRRAPGRRLVL